MANKPGDINANVGVTVNESGMSGTLKTLKDQVAGIITSLNQAGLAAEKAILKGGKAGAEAAQQMRMQLDALAKTQGAIRNLKGANSQVLFGEFASGQKVGEMASGMNKFFRGLESGAPVVDKLNSRLKLMNLQASEMLNNGKVVPANFWAKRLGVEEALGTFKKLETAQNKFRDRFESLSPQGKQQAKGMFAAYDNALNQFSRYAGDSRTSTTLTNQANILRDMTADMGKRLKIIEAEDKLNNRLLATTRSRAQAILDMGRAEREAQLRSGANRYQTLLAGRSGGGQFNDIIGDPIARLRTTGMDSLARSTAAAHRVQLQLNSALNSNAGADRIQQLIGRYQQLTRIQQQSLAMAEKETQPGFFGGIKQGFATVAHGPGGAGFGGLGGAGNLVGRVAAFTAAYQGISAVQNALQGAVTFAIEFEDKLAQLQAISGATGIEMQRLSQNILDVSKNSANSIIEITESAKILAQAGYSASETQQLLQNVVNLSAASGATPAEAVDIMTSALGAFRLQASDSTQVADSLVAVLNESKLAVNQVQLGLQYLGATAKENNINFETLIATLGAAADAGIRSGSTMATGTRQLLIDLQDPSKKLVEELTRIGLTMGDIDVKTKGLLPVLRTLKENGFDAFGTVETRAAAMYEVLANNTDNIERLREATLRNNTAAQAAEKRISSLSAQWQILKNRAGEVGETLGSIFIPAMKDLITVVGAVLDVLKPLVEILATVINFFQDVSLIDMAINGFDGFGNSASKLNRELEETTTRLNDAKSATNTQRESLNSLEDEMGSIINRYDTLAKSNADTAYEVNRLSERFPGLREEFSKTQGGVEGLITSLFKLRGEMLETLRQKAQFELNAGIQQESKLRQTGIQQAKNLRNKYRPSSETLSDPIFRNSPLAALIDRQNRIVTLLLSSKSGDRERGNRELTAFLQDQGIKQSQKDTFFKDVQDFISTRMDYWAQQSANRANNEFIKASAFSVTPQGKAISDKVFRSSEDAVAALSEAEGLTQTQRRAVVTKELREAESNLLEITRLIKEMTAKGDKAAVTTLKELENSQKITIRNLKGAGKATDDEEKAANARPRGPGAGRTMNSAQLKAALEQQFPGIVISSGYRGPGHKLYSPGSWHSDQPGGRAVDIARLPKGTTIDNVIAFLESLGQAIDLKNPNSFLDEFKNPSRRATGGHWHLGVSAKQSRATSEAQRELEEEQAEQAQQEVKLASLQVQAKKRQLQASQQSLADAQTNAEISERSARVFSDWVAYAEASKKAADAEIKKQGMDPNEAAEYLASLRERLTAEWQEISRKNADALIKAMSDFLKDSEKAIKAEYARRLHSSTTNLARQEGIMEGLGLPENQGRVPEYTRVLQQRNIDNANRDVRNDTYSANAMEIQRRREELFELGRQVTIQTPKTEADRKRIWDEYAQNVDTVKGKILELETAQARLDAQNAAMAQAPKTWGEAMTQAVQAWQIQNNAGQGLGERMWQNLGTVIESVHGSFQTFFTDILTGTKTVGQAFGDMAKAIVSALLEMAAKAIATQIFSLLLSFLPGAAGGIGAGGANFNPAHFSGAIGGFTGGLVPMSGNTPPIFTPKFYTGGRVGKYAQGGLIRGGIPTRDTVPSLLSKGEFVMRRSAVEDIGHRMLMDMNNRGSAALNKVGARPVIMNGASQPVETNVYVVLPEEKPQLGPNDVLAVVHNDMLRNGTTKRLIKSVAAGN